VHAIGKLQKRFPVAFPKKPEPKLPLKVGILADLLPHAEQLGLSEAEIREAIATWCRGSRYWSCLTEGAARVDLNGEPAGQVNARDVAFARSSQRGGPRRPRGAGAAGAPAGEAVAASAGEGVAASAGDAATASAGEAAAAPAGEAAAATASEAVAAPAGEAAPAAEAASAAKASAGSGNPAAAQPQGDTQAASSSPAASPEKADANS